MNFAFTIIFAVEMCLKVFGFGVKGYLRDMMNIIDGLIVIVSLVEIFFFPSGGNNSSAGF